MTDEVMADTAAEAVTATDDNTPGAVIVDEYLADFSIENPGGRVPPEQAAELALGLDVGVRATLLETGPEELFAVSIALSMPARIGEKIIFLIEMRYQVNVRLRGVGAADATELLYVQVPNAVFPTLKSIVEKNGAFAGYPEVELFPIDFAAMAHSRMQELTQISQ